MVVGTTAIRGSRSTTCRREERGVEGGRARPMSSSPRRMPSTWAPVTRSESSTSTSGSAAVSRRSSWTEDGDRRDGGKAEAYDARRAGIDAAGQVAGGVDQVEQPVGLVEKGGPCAGELDPAVVALEQLRADRPLQLLDLPGQRGLGHRSRSAARPKCSSSATATKQRTWSKVITAPAYDARYHAMPNRAWTGIAAVPSVGGHNRRPPRAGQGVNDAQAAHPPRAGIGGGEPRPDRVRRGVDVDRRRRRRATTRPAPSRCTSARTRAAPAT